MPDDNLETLDNASLRKKCLEFGLPNVPITDTSRKLLIKRLRAAMTGEKAEKKKNRRETVHVTKIPPAVEAPVDAIPERLPSRVNRRTIAVTSVTSTVDDDILLAKAKPAEVVDKRRSVRAPIEHIVPISIPVSQKRRTAVVEEDDEDDDDVIMLEAAEKSEQEATEILLPRSRRSVSLSKTGVVTTSYSQESAIVPPTVNETESESDNDFASKYVSSYEPVTRPLSQTQPTLFGLSQRKVSVEPDRISAFRTSTVNRTSIDPEPIYKPTLLPSRYSSLGSGYAGNTASSVTTSSSTRRFTTGGYGGPSASTTKYTTAYADDDEDEENDEGETPYLSDFARKLERLKAEPLAKGIESPRMVPMKRETQRYQSSIQGRRSTTQKESVGDSFRNFLHALDHKYKLKRNFSILFAVILCLFIYIVFIH